MTNLNSKNYPAINRLLADITEAAPKGPKNLTDQEKLDYQKERKEWKPSKKKWPPVKAGDIILIFPEERTKRETPLLWKALYGPGGSKADKPLEHSLGLIITTEKEIGESPGDGFYFVPVNDRFDIINDYGRPNVMHSNMLLSDDIKVVHHKPLQKHSYKGHTWYLTGNDAIDLDKMANVDGRQKIFKEYAPQRLKDIYERQEDINFHSENAQMVNDFCEWLENGKKAEDFIAVEVGEDNGGANASVEGRSDSALVKNIRHKGHYFTIIKDGNGFVFQLDGLKYDNNGEPWKSEMDAYNAIKEYVQVNKKSLNEVEAAANDDMLSGYLSTALWSTNDQSDERGGRPMDENYSLDDIDPETIARAEKDCADFEAKAGNLLDGLDMGTVGHDFWLTRNGHGAGFWDGDYEKSVGDALTKISKEFGEVDLYVGDDGKIYSGVEDAEKTEAAKEKWIVIDWAGNEIKMPKPYYPSFEDAWGALYEKFEHLSDEEAEQEYQEYEVIQK